MNTLFSLFGLKKIVSILLMPPMLPIALLLLGLTLRRKWAKFGSRLHYTGLALLILLSTPVSVNLLIKPLENIPTIDETALKNTQAIVILAGGQRRNNEEYDGRASVNRITLERVRFGAQLAKASHLPVLLSGGAPRGAEPESVLMAQTLSSDFGVTPKWIEANSLDTAENAMYSAKILKGANVQRITLVTHAAHMRRAIGEFERTGLIVTPAPMAFLNDDVHDYVAGYFPNMTASYNGWYAVHEWLGLLAQKLRFIAQP